MRHRGSVLAAAAVALLLMAASSSRAADPPSRLPDKAAPASAAPFWRGPYIGLFTGYGWGRGRATAAFDSNTGFFYNWTGNGYSPDSAGGFGGGTLGDNWQAGPLVWGLEGEFGVLRLRGSERDPNFQPGTAPLNDTVTRFKSDLYGAAYGRIGIANGAVLLYGKGGAALLRAEASTIDPCAGTPGCGTGTLTMTGTRTMVGWAAGGGIEWLFRPQWSARVEYLYYNFGGIDTAGPSNVPGEYYRQSIAVTAQTLKLGINCRF
jgi:outer membrane immunogenic protein